MNPRSTTLRFPPRGVCAVTLGLLTAALSAQAPKPQLVKDINTTTPPPSGGSNPSASRSYPGNVYDSGFLHGLPHAYFAATTWRYGTEPYMSNGSVAGAVMLGDINPGTGSSSPHEFTLSSDRKKLFFRANDGKTGDELWVCDLTASPPKCSLVKDIYAGTSSSYPTHICAIGNKVVFYAVTAATGAELFVSDGTTAGTSLLKDINPGAGGSYPRSMKTSIKGDKAFFCANDGRTSYELWVTDGTPGGTMMVMDINRGTGPSSPYAFQDLGDSKTTKMVFMADNGTYGEELWISDGTTANTRMIKDVYSGSSSGCFSYYSVVYNGKLYFRGNDGSSGYEIWETDGTAAGTKQVFDTYPGSSSGYFYDPVLENGRIYYRANNGINGYELWVHDPAATTNPTHMVKDINAGFGSSSPTCLAATLTGKVFFYANDGTHGYELHVSDGTAAGTMMVKDIYTGSSSGYAYAIAETTPGRVAFRSNDGTHGYELWVSNGTSTGTVRVPLETNPVKRTNPSYVDYIAEMNGKVYFSANDGKNGYELWSSDGTAAGTQMVKDINPGPASGYALYNTRLGNRILFRGYTSATGDELWESDGTAAGTKLLKDLMPGPDSSSPTYLQRIGDKVYFTANSGQGYELHVTDGTAAGTMQVADLYPGSGSSYGYFSRALLPNGLICIGYAHGKGQGYEMAVTDGTAKGTKILDLRPGSTSSYPRFMTAYKGKVYFSADLGSGYELCVTDGTVAGTKMVKDVYAGIGSSYWYDLATDGKLLYGYCYDPNGGYELWASDGTAAGTKRLADIVPGTGSSYARYHSPIGSRHVYFQATDGSNGYELFRWDGSKVKSWDIWPGGDSSYPYNYVGSDYQFEPMNGYLYFRAQDGIVGYELFRMNNGATATDSYPNCGNITLSGTDPLINSTAKVNLSNPNATPMSVLLLGTVAPTPFNLPGSTCPFFVNLATMSVMGVSVKANASFSFPIPNDKTLEGANVVFQAVDIKGFPMFDTSNPLQWTLSTL